MGCLKGYPRDRGRVMELLIGGEFLSYPSLIDQLKKGYPFRQSFKTSLGICILSRFSAQVGPGSLQTMHAQTNLCDSCKKI